MNKANNILIVDDQAIAYRGLKSIILDYLPETIIELCLSFDGALKACDQNKRLIIIIDINLDKEINLNSVKKIKDINPNADILIFSSSNEHFYALPYLKAGAIGYLSKLASEAEILKAIKTVISGERYMSETVSKNLMNKLIEGELSMASLSPRELQVSEMLAKGHGVLDISKMLNLQMGTISTYKTRILEKLNVRNTVELAEKINTIHKMT